jgi:hypothetical protein
LGEALLEEVRVNGGFEGEYPMPNDKNTNIPEYSIDALPPIDKGAKPGAMGTYDSKSGLYIPYVPNETDKKAGKREDNREAIAQRFGVRFLCIPTNIDIKKGLIINSIPSLTSNIVIDRSDKDTDEALKRTPHIETFFNKAIAHLISDINKWLSSDTRLVALSKYGFFSNKDAVLRLFTQDLFGGQKIKVKIRQILTFTAEAATPPRPFKGTLNGKVGVTDIGSLIESETANLISSPPDNQRYISMDGCVIKLDEGMMIMYSHLFWKEIGAKMETVPEYYKEIMGDENEAPCKSPYSCNDMDEKGIYEGDKKTAWVFWESTFLHELVHVGYHLMMGAGNSKRPEEGEQFEGEAYFGDASTEVGFQAGSVGGRLAAARRLIYYYSLNKIQEYEKGTLNKLYLKGKNKVITENNSKLPPINRLMS